MTVRGSRLLARFAVESKRFSGSIVKPKLFEPTRELKLSVFRIEQLSCDEICALGMCVVSLLQVEKDKKLYGWGEVGESEVCNVGLRVEHDDNPPGHANVVDWPIEPNVRKLVQIKLAKLAKAVILKPPKEAPA